MNIFSFPLPYLIHALLMIAASIFFAGGWYLARYKKKRSWWLKGHRVLNSLGFVVAVTAFTVIFGFKIYLASGHFSGIHSIVGIAALLLFSITPLPATVFKKKRDIHRLHPWFGYLALLTAAAAVTLGFLYINGII